MNNCCVNFPVASILHFILYFIVDKNSLYHCKSAKFCLIALNSIDKARIVQIFMICSDNKSKFQWSHNFNFLHIE